MARLRRHFNDELLFRVGNDYRLTPLAVHLKARTTVALAGAERVFSALPDFEPAESTREFTLLVSDYSVAVLEIPWPTCWPRRLRRPGFA